MAYSQIEITLGGLTVSVSTELSYPDGIDDLCTRGLAVFKECMNTAKANNVDVTVMMLHTTLPEDFDD